MRVIEALHDIGNFNAAVEILMGLKSTKLRPFWLSLKHEERQRYDEFVDILLPNEDRPPHALYLEAVQKALRMQQCRVIPFFGTFLRDLYAIVNDMPNIVVIGSGDGDNDILKFLNDVNGDDHFSSSIGVGGLLNTEKINLISVFHKHHKEMGRYLEPPGENTNGDAPEAKSYEPVQPVQGPSHGVTLIPLNTQTFDLDDIQRIQQGTTVIHYDPDSGRSVLCRLTLDASCSTVSWHRVYYGGKEGREKDIAAVSKATMNLQTMQLETAKSSQSSCPSPRPPGSALVNLDEGFIRTTYIKAVEAVDSYDLDIEVVKCIQEQNHYLDRRMLWLKKLYLQLYNEKVVMETTRRADHAQWNAFRHLVEGWRNGATSNK